MTVEGKQSFDWIDEDEDTDVGAESAPAVADDDEVEAHVWRAQS